MDKPGGKVTKKEELLEAKKKLESIISSSKCTPILVRLAWHDSGTYVSRHMVPDDRQPAMSKHIYKLLKHLPCSLSLHTVHLETTQLAEL